MPSLRDLLDRNQVVLAEGAIIERVRRNPLVPLNPFVADATLVSDQRGRLLLTRLHREYIDIARDAGLPALVLTSTWRASRERLERAGLPLSVNDDSAKMMNEVRNWYRGYSSSIVIGGLIGPKGDAYKPATALPADAAYRYHKPQVEALAFSGVDFLIASTLPALTEALGIARAMAETGMPYILSFITRPDGALLDGNLLASAIRAVGEAARPRPLGVMLNCVHPETGRQALAGLAGTPDLRRQVIGLQANASRRAPGRLDGSDETDSGDPEEFGREMAALRRDYGLRILGGCCGTDGRHIRAVAEALARS
ncbi:homocysteine S-methyltransferase family protein [candidate division WOR-3 bacterium]|nr:homocysteine S-methyltransferase family protein [candidate division WOR-3 bacterium]